ncbi:MAG: hypothetical protein AB7U23_14495 [Dehalococcoidia bacterium]
MNWNADRPCVAQVAMHREGDEIESPRRMRRLKELLRINHRLLDLGDRLGMSRLARARMGLR